MTVEFLLVIETHPILVVHVFPISEQGVRSSFKLELFDWGERQAFGRPIDHARQLRVVCRVGQDRHDGGGQLMARLRTCDPLVLIELKNDDHQANNRHDIGRQGDRPTDLEERILADASGR